MLVNQKIRRTAATGFTLIELLLVLVVVAGLAGMLLPILPNVITRTHAATTAGSVMETANAIQLYEQQRLVHPDRWDSLIQPDGQTLRADRFTVVDLTDGTPLAGRISSALAAIGISESLELVEGIQGNGRPDGHSNAPTARINTFAPYSGVVYDLTPGTTNGSVVTLGGTALNELNRLGLDDPAIDPNIEAYVVFGLGAQSTMIGRSMQAAPVHFPGQGDFDPTLAYARCVAVYAIPTEGPARLAATAAVHTDHLDSTGNLLEEFWETTR